MATSSGTVRALSNCCQLIPPNRFLNGFFQTRSQFAPAKLTHDSLKPQRPSDSSYPRQCFLLSGDVHPESISYYKISMSVRCVHVVVCLLRPMKRMGWLKFSICLHNCQFHYRRLGSLEHLIVFVDEVMRFIVEWLIISVDDVMLNNNGGRTLPWSMLLFWFLHPVRSLFSFTYNLWLDRIFWNNLHSLLSYIVELLDEDSTIHCIVSCR